MSDKHPSAQRRRYALTLTVLLAAAALSGCLGTEPAPPTSTLISNSNAAAKSSPSVTPTPAARPSPTPSVSPTPTPRATPTPSPTPAGKQAREERKGIDDDTAASDSGKGRARRGGGGKGYYNVDGEWVPSPVFSKAAPEGATAQCRDGSYSFSRNRRGTCSHHGGVARWL